MQRTATLLTLSLLLAGTALAQPNRVGEDLIWARDIGSATITVDGTLSEPVWAQAETYRILWNGDHPLPGGGQQFEDNPTGLVDPVDPTDATVHVLRKGNELYLAFEVDDASIGGQRGFFAGDGVMMTLVRKSDRPETFETFNNYFESSAVREEMFYGWQHPRDTLATGEQVPGIAPKAWSTDFGLTAGDSSDATPRNPEAWEYAATVDGVSNDDFNGGSTFTPDNGYVMEMRIRLDSLGWDLTQPMSRMPITIAIEDRDFSWPQDLTRFTRTRTWWQGRWFNNFNEGAVYIAGDPGVTVSSGAAPAYTEPEFVIPNGANGPAPTIDGVLSEDLWTNVDPQFQLQYQAPADSLDAWLPGVLAPNYTFYFHPDSNPVLDPTVGKFHMFFRGSTLYVGLDTDDQAVNGIEAENSRDGFRLTISALDSLKSNLGGALAGVQLDFSVDSTGAVRLGNYAAALDTLSAGAIQAAASMKGESTAGNAEDIDTGYQMEVAVDLTALGYPANLGDGRIWLSLNYFDGDALPNNEQSYGTRVWVIGERANGATLYGYLDPSTLVVTSGEGGPTEAAGLRVFGTFPNPTAGTATLRYELPRASEVTVDLFDMLGRHVQTIEAGLQAAGMQRADLSAAGLSVGAYVYRVRMSDGTSVTGRMLVTR